MKKMLAVLLVLIMVLSSAICLAEGTQTDKPIVFAGYNFGDTFGSIRGVKRFQSIDFQYGRYSARFLGDVAYYMASFGYDDAVMPLCFSARFNEISKVAGFEASARLWFVYPIQNDTVLCNESDAILYAGQYEFHQGDKKEIYQSLKQKLAQVYGEAYYTGGNLSDALGDMPIDENFKEYYCEEMQRVSPEYAVWKSKANDSVIVLAFCLQNGNEPMSRLTYISNYAEENFTRIQEMSGSSGSDSLGGL